MRNPLLRWIPILIPIIAVFGILFYFQSRPKTVPVVRPETRTVVESIAAAGRVRGQVETSVGAQTGGRVDAVLVREGDKVTAGQVIARLDDSVLRAQVTQAEDTIRTAEAQMRQSVDAVETAKAQLAQASRPPLASDVTRLKADIAQAVAVAEAQLAGARQRLAELNAGATREQRQQVTAQVLQAEANVEQAEREYARQKSLYEQGAVARQAMENAETSLKVAKRTLESIQAQQKEQQVGTRPEQIAQAKAEIRRAEATVAGAKASGAAQLRSLLATPRQEDVRVAQRRLDEAQQARQVAEARVREARKAREVAVSRLGDAIVRAPFDGTITQIVTEAGGVTGSNQPIVRLVRWSTPEIRIDVDEIYLGKLKVGLEGIVTSDAFPGEKFTARVREIGAQVSIDRGTVEVRLTPVDPPTWLRPGQTVSVNIITNAGTPRLVVPLTSVTTVGGTSSALVIEAGAVVRKDLTVGAPGPDGLPVIEGLQETDVVITNPVGLAVGQKVVPQFPTAKNGKGG